MLNKLVDNERDIFIFSLGALVGTVVVSWQCRDLAYRRKKVDEYIKLNNQMLQWISYSVNNDDIHTSREWNEEFNVQMNFIRLAAKSDV